MMLSLFWTAIYWILSNVSLASIILLLIGPYNIIYLYSVVIPIALMIVITYIHIRPANNGDNLIEPN